ncbi:MAG: sulfurtransferase TusA family protein [Lysobacterales bacterium]
MVSGLSATMGVSLPTQSAQQSGVASKMKVDCRVDARGLTCPEPVIKARLGISGLAAGQTLELLASDPHAELDVEVFCATTGHQLQSVEKREAHWRFLITAGPSPKTDQPS